MEPFRWFLSIQLNMFAAVLRSTSNIKSQHKVCANKLNLTRTRGAQLPVYQERERENKTKLYKDATAIMHKAFLPRMTANW